MRAPKEKNQLNEPGTRRLTIQPGYSSNLSGSYVIPQIRLQGKWLEELGFSPRQRVKVITENKRLILQVE